jgi:hypothetical protein
MSRDRLLEEREKRVLESLDSLEKRWKNVCRKARQRFAGART